MNTISASTELQSQRQLLEGIQLFSRFNSNVIQVKGELGSGKSYLVQRYIEAWCEHQTCVFISGQDSATLAQQRMRLFEQLNNQLSDVYPWDGQQTLDKNFTTHLAQQPVQLSIVVDDAHLLFDEILSELCALVLAAQENAHWQINVILFALAETIELNLMHAYPQQQIKFLAIEPLPFAEVEWFVAHIVLQGVDDEKKCQRYLKLAHKASAYPGNLLQLQPQAKAGVTWLQKSLIVLIALLIVFGGWSWWVNRQVMSPSSSNLVTVTSEFDVKQPQQLSQPQVGTNQTDISMTDEPQQQDEAQLPPDVIDETITVGAKQAQQQRVVVPADVVDALLDDKQPPSNKRAPAVNAQQGLLLAEQSLLALAEQRYTIQLAAMATEQSAQDFITKYQLQGVVRVYQTTNNSKHWYIITYKDYATIQQAREAITEMADELQQESPWPKSLRQVHREIEHKIGSQSL